MEWFEVCQPLKTSCGCTLNDTGRCVQNSHSVTCCRLLKEMFTKHILCHSYQFIWSNVQTHNRFPYNGTLFWGDIWLGIIKSGVCKKREINIGRSCPQSPSDKWHPCDLMILRQGFQWRSSLKQKVEPCTETPGLKLIGKALSQGATTSTDMYVYGLLCLYPFSLYLLLG